MKRGKILISYPVFLLFLILLQWKKIGKMNRYWIEISTLILVATLYLFMIYLVSKGIHTERFDYPLVISFLVISVCNMLFLKLPYLKKIKTGKEGKVFDTYLQVVNSVMAICALPAILFINECIVFVILVAIAVYSINVKKLLDHKLFILNLYVGVKYTILLLVILKAWEVTGIITSMSCLLLSAVSIGVGFGISQKALRIY